MKSYPVSFVSNNLRQRYFTPSQALEYRIPAAELRMRDPLTGNKTHTNASISLCT